MTTNEELIARLNSLANELEFQEDEMSQILSEAADRLAALTTPQEGDAHARVAQVVSDALDAELPEDQRTGEPTDHAWGKLAMIEHLRARAAEIREGENDE